MRLASFLSALGLQSDGAASDADPYMRRLQKQLVRLGPARIEYLAGFAGELARVADVDDGISATEAALIKSQLIERGLTADEAGVVIDLLRHQLEALHSLQNHTLNRAVNKYASPEDKAMLIDCLYAIAAVDRGVSDAEEQEIRRIGDALLVPHSVQMNIRARYRDRIASLQAMPRGAR